MTIFIFYILGFITPILIVLGLVWKNTFYDYNIRCFHSHYPKRITFRKPIKNPQDLRYCDSKRFELLGIPKNSVLLLKKFKPCPIDQLKGKFISISDKKNTTLFKIFYVDAIYSSKILRIVHPYIKLPKNDDQLNTSNIIENDDYPVVSYIDIDEIKIIVENVSDLCLKYTE